MFDAWWKLGVDASILALESQTVIGLRLAKLAAGDAAAQSEAQRMVSDKVLAASEAAMLVATGGSAEKVIAGYLSKVRANQRRLTSQL